MNKYLFAFSLLLVPLPAHAGYNRIYLGEMWTITVPDNCILDVKTEQITCKVADQVTMFLDWKIVSQGKNFTQEHHQEVAVDPIKGPKSIQSMKHRIVEYTRVHKDTMSSEPQAFVRVIGEGVWATIGAGTTDQGAYVSKVQIWNHGLGGELTGVTFGAEYYTSWWSIVDSIRMKYMGEN